jgi:hypothetical protein
LVYEFDASKEKKKKLNLPFPIVKSLKNPNQNSNDNHSYSSNVIFSKRITSIRSWCKPVPLYPPIKNEQIGLSY